MRPTALWLSMFFIPLGLLLAGPATSPPAAATTIDLSWNACSPIQSVVQPGLPGPLPLYLSAFGQADLHLGYQFRFAVSGAQGQVPDAWRFDSPGCQGRDLLAITTRPNPFVATTCPAFAGPITTAEMVTYQYEPPGTGVPPDMISGFVSHTYDARFGPHDPTQRYFLGRFVFDHTYSVSGATIPGAYCGGFEWPVCIELVPSQCWWLDMQGNPVAFQIGVGTAGFLEACSPLPAAPTTWGAIKSTYRR